jgi:universal stress protein E
MSRQGWKTLLVVISNPFAAKQPALNKAVALSLRSGARLVLFNSFMIPQPVSDVPMDSREQIIKSAIRERRERLEELVSHTRVEAKCIVNWDYPAHEAIVRQVLKTRPDVVMTASHRHGRLARWLLANTDWELIRQCPCPVWFVRSPQMSEEPRILVAVDPFHAHEKPAALDERLIRAARAVSEQFKGRITLVHACQVPDGAQAVRSLVLGRARQSVHDLAERHGISRHECEVRTGRPEEVIAAIERRDGTDLLVMGAVSRSVEERPVIGNTAERVIDRVSCDLLVIKPAGFRVPKLSAPARSKSSETAGRATTRRQRAPVAANRKRPALGGIT